MDIGANLGYFCHKFEDEGFDCYAFEISERYLYLMKKLKRAENKKFKIIEKSVLDIEGELNFDVVLALNIFHHFLKEEEIYNKFIEFLGRLKAKEMFFQSHRVGEPQMKSAFKNFRPHEFADFILEHSNFQSYKLIGEDKGRLIYKFT